MSNDAHALRGTTDISWGFHMAPIYAAILVLIIADLAEVAKVAWIRVDPLAVSGGGSPQHLRGVIG